MRPLAFGAVLGVAVLIGGAASAATLEIKDAWIRSTTPGMPTAVAYATIVNHGFTSDRLTGVRTGAAASAELHQMTTAGGVMRMRPVAGGIAIGGSATVKLSPGGQHLMLVGVKRPMKAGSHVKITFEFQRAGAVAADFVVRDAPPPSGMAGMHM
jgi:hypothetical protein